MQRRVMIGMALGLTLSGGVFAGSAADDVVVSGAYARAVPPGQPNSAAFMVLENRGSDAHALMAAESPAAKVVELHTHKMEGGMMRMRQVPKIDLPAKAVTKLQPGGLHIMLIGLRHGLNDGDQISLTLKFEDGSQTQVTAPVRKLRMKMMKDMKMPMQSGEGSAMKHGMQMQH